MRKIKINLVFMLSILFWVASYNIWQITDGCVYYISTAQVILVASYIIHTRTFGIHHVISRAFVFIAISNLADEILFERNIAGWNEFIVLFIFLIYSIYKWKITKYSNG